MKTITSFRYFNKLVFFFILLILLISRGCYYIYDIIQPSSVESGIPFTVKITIKTEEDTDPSEFGSGYGCLGILLPIGWKVNDSIPFSKTKSTTVYEGKFVRDPFVENFYSNRFGLAPSGYYWWGSCTKDKVELKYGDTGNITIRITPNNVTGNFKLKYIFGDDFQYAKPDQDRFGFPFNQGSKSDFIPISVIVSHSEKIKNSDGFKVYPNPATDQVTFSWNENLGMLNLKMYNPNGTCVIDKEISPEQTIDVSGLPEAIYLYRLSDKYQLVKTGKLLIK